MARESFGECVLDRTLFINELMNTWAGASDSERAAIWLAIIKANNEMLAFALRRTTATEAQNKQRLQKAAVLALLPGQRAMHG